MISENSKDFRKLVNIQSSLVLSLQWKNHLCVAMGHCKYSEILALAIFSREKTSALVKLKHKMDRQKQQMCQVQPHGIL